ncbi:hypothetical protein TSMEX_003256 [Taenia solium]|eukprot:TsM_000367700 transcript=TsM_000367700 gene=TsM_000367700
MYQMLQVSRYCYALLHPHSANLDKKSLPAVGEKYVGLPTSRTLQDFAELFNALTSIDESDLGGENEEWTEEVEETLDKMVTSASYLLVVRFVQF